MNKMTFEGVWPWPTLDYARQQAKIVAERYCASFKKASEESIQNRDERRALAFVQDYNECVQWNYHKILVKWQQDTLD
jgi:hypothetical protein